MQSICRGCKQPMLLSASGSIGDAVIWVCTCGELQLTGLHSVYGIEPTARELQECWSKNPEQFAGLMKFQEQMIERVSKKNSDLDE
jgi:hypothetical protein